MAKLSERDLMLLSSIIYSNYMFQYGSDKREDNSLGRLVDEMLKLPDEDLKKIGFNGGDFPYLESNKDSGEGIKRFREVLEEVKKSPDLMRLKIEHPQLNDGSKSDSISAARFVDPNDNSATVVFRGTDGSYKAWNDNFEGAGNDNYTLMQNDVINYMDKIKGYSSVDVTGHSKGGNFAALPLLCVLILNVAFLLTVKDLVNIL